MPLSQFPDHDRGLQYTEPFPVVTPEIGGQGGTREQGLPPSKLPVGWTREAVSSSQLDSQVPHRSPMRHWPLDPGVTNAFVQVLGNVDFKPSITVKVLLLTRRKLGQVGGAARPVPRSC